MGDLGFADNGVSGRVGPGIEKGVPCLPLPSVWRFVLMAVMGSQADCCIGVLHDRSTTVAYTLERVLNAVGSRGSLIRNFRDEAILELGAGAVLIWRAGRRAFD
jgi:hypothetical protein